MESGGWAELPLTWALVSDVVTRNRSLVSLKERVKNGCRKAAKF